jgi:hypothetical protein
VQRQREAANPQQIHQEIYEGLRRLRQIPLADPNQADDSRQSLVQNTEVEMEQLFTSSVPVIMAGD